MQTIENELLESMCQALIAYEKEVYLSEMKMSQIDENTTQLNFSHNKKTMSESITNIRKTLKLNNIDNHHHGINKEKVEAQKAIFHINEHLKKQNNAVNEFIFSIDRFHHEFNMDLFIMHILNGFEKSNSTPKYILEIQNIDDTSIRILFKLNILKHIQINHIIES